MPVDVKFKKGLEADLSNASKVEGAYYQCTDTGRLYLCVKNSSSALEFVEVGNLIHDENGEPTSLKTRQGTNNASWGHDSSIISSTDSTAIGDRSSIISSENSVIRNNTKNSSILASVDCSIYIPESPRVERYASYGEFPTEGEPRVFYIAEDTGNAYIYSEYSHTYSITQDKQYESWTNKTGQAVIIASSGCTTDGSNYSWSEHCGSNTAIMASQNAEMKSIYSAIIGGKNNKIEHNYSVILGGEDIITDREKAVYVNEIDFVADHNKNGGVRRAVLSVGNSITAGNTQFFNFPSTGGTLVAESEPGQIRSDISSAQSDITTHTGDSHITTAQTSGLYKISVSNQGHITGVMAVQKSDITDLDIPGTDTTYDDANTTTHGLMSASDKKKLDGIATGADSIKVSRTITDGTEIAKIKINDGDDISLFAPADINTTYTFAGGTNSFTATSSTDSNVQTVTIKQEQANWNQTTTTAADYIKNKPTIVSAVKVGTTQYDPADGIVTLQPYPTTLPASDVSSWAKASTKPSYTAAEVGAIPTSAKGANNGVAELDDSGKVPSTQLPSYVDDVLEFANKSSFPATGESGKIYVDTNENLTYRWSGTQYVEISKSLGLGETSDTAYAGNKGKAVTDNLASHVNNTTVHITDAERTSWNEKTTNIGTVTGVKMNGGDAKIPDESGTVDLGTVLTSSSTDTVPNVTAVGSATTASVSNGLLTITTGSAPTLGNAISVVTSVS